MKLEDRLVNVMLNNNIIREDDREIYRYGLRTLKLKLISYMSAMIIAVLLGRLSYFAVILVSFMSVRKYAGGFHEDTAVKCFVVSQILFIILEVGSKYIVRYDIGVMTAVILGIIGTVLIMKNAPVESVHHRLSDKQKCKYRKIALISCCVWNLIILGLFFLKEYEYIVVAALSLSFQGILTVIPERK